ncbi:MAG TPA: SBBP repeat-containing protein, partial [Chitinophagales bacterium]|nr:SBBP repeat-containing protein [Chitinophagales bacterium]
MVSNTDGKLSIWQNIGTAGTLSAASFATRIDINSNAWSMTVTDLDVDGKPDIIVSPAISSVISVFRNISTPGTLTAASFATNIDYPVGAWGDFLTTGDLDGDHKPEILSSSWPSATFTILQNSTSPGTINATSFTSRTDMPTGSEPRGLVITDFDGDGKNDVILALQIASQVMVFKNISTPGPLSTSSFSPSVNFTAGGNLRGVTGADFDGDGKPDIAVANWSGPPVSVLRNTVSSLPPLTGSSFSPASGPIGSLVTITGTNFSTTLLNNTVKFNGVVATVISATSTSIDTTVPVGATTGPISVQVGCNTMVTFSNFTVTTPPPLSSPALVWAKQIGGSSTDLGLSTAIDAAGNVYTTGAFVGTVDFDPGAGVTNLTSNGSFDVFITKFDAAGNLKWAKSVGAVPDERGQGITVDPSGNVYVTGYFFNTVDFDPDAVATFPLTSYGSRDVFILKLDGLGNFVWAKRMGSTSTDEGKSIVLDHSGNILTTGYFNSSGRFDPGNSSTTITSSGLTDIFVSKLDPSGNYLWSKKMGGTFFDQGYALDVDGSDNVLISGFFQRTADFDPGAGTFNLVSNANSNDIFISKLDASGNFVWAKQIGGPGDEIANSIAVDASDNVISTGRMYFDFSGTPIDFDPGAGVFNLTPVAGNSSSFPDIFISKLNSSGTFVWAKQMSGVSYEEAFSVDVDISGNVYVTGDFVGTVDFDPGPSSFDLTSSGYDIFVSKLDASGNFGWVESFGGTGFDVGYGIAVNSSGFIATTGSMSATGDFAPGSCLYNLTSNGSDDIFIQKLTQSTIPPPIITSFSPSSGPAGTVVVITGANFDPIPSNNIVRFNGLLTTVSASSGTSITTIVPVGALDGTISVDVICSSGTSPTPFDVTGACNIPHYERSALTDLYNSTNGAGWTNSTNWNSADESTWHGITVSGCRVSQIDLSANQLNGALPATIANLGSLQILKLFDNALTGSLPATIGNQTALTQLQLQHNSLTGVIPSSLATCTALQNINLEGNQFSGTIPSFLGSLSGLSSINLGHNGFSGNIPTTLGSLPLTFLSLAGNALTGNIPTQLGNLSSLVLLDLSDNQLTGTLPVQLGQLSSLVSLQLFSNQFSGSYLTQLENLANLQELNLSQNQLTGPVVSNFANMPVLRILLLNDNQLDGAFSSSISSLTALQTVSLARNHFTSIPVIGSYDLFVENNNLDFASLEPNVASTVNFSYDPQAKLPPGGSIFFTVGGTLIIPFTTGGTSNSYQWYNMGIPVPGATSLSLSKPGMTQADAGIYYLQVTNSVVTGITLESVPYLVFTDPCSAITPTYGDLDVPFDPQIDVPTSVSAIGIQSTGKILMAANNSVINGTAFHGIVRFNTDGTLDNSFNTIDYYENVMLVQVDDKIVTVDASYVSTYLIRLDEDGNSDGSFNPSINTDIVYALGLQSDGNILVSHNDSGTDRITRLLPDGSTDPSFTAPQDLPSNVIKVQSNGFILAGGFFPDGIVRLDASGNIDPGFNGYADGEVTDIAIQPDGKIILVGSFQYVNGVPHRGIARLNIDGSLDNTFRAIGISDAVSLENYPAKIALQGNGQIIIAGIFSSVSGTGRVNLAKLNSDGTIDCTFDPELSTNFPISSLQLQANGKILIGGDFTTYDGVTRNGFARVNNLQNSSCVPASQRAALVALYN